MWDQNLTTDLIIQEMNNRNYICTLDGFVFILHMHVEAYIRIAFQYPLSKNKVVRHYKFLKNLVVKRDIQFIKSTGCISSGIHGITMTEVVHD